jgi:hypothetical protein
MPAARAELILPSGTNALHCPACGTAVFYAEEGVNEKMCGHILFLLDWNGEIWLPEPEGHNAALLIHAIDTIWNDSERWSEAESRIVAALPENCLVLCIDQPATGPEDDGSYIAVAVNMGVE